MGTPNCSAWTMAPMKFEIGRESERLTMSRNASRLVRPIRTSASACRSVRTGSVREVSLIADPGVESGIQKVDEQVHDQEDMEIVRTPPYWINVPPC